MEVQREEGGGAQRGVRESEQAGEVPRGKGC